MPGGDRGRSRSVSAARAGTAPAAPPAQRQRTIAAYAKKKKAKPLALKASKAKKPQTKEQIQYMSPKGKDYPPVQPQSLGNFLCVNDLIREAHATSTSAKQVVLFAPSVRGVFQVFRFEQILAHTAGAPVPLLSSYFMSPTWKYQAADSPLISRPLRASLTISNMSSADMRSNGVTILNTSSPIVLQWCNASGVVYGTTGFTGNPDHITEASFDKLWLMIHASPDSTFCTANSLSTGHNEVVAFPCTSSAYASYGNRNFQTDGSWLGVADQMKIAETDMPMSHILLGFPQTSDANDYSLEFQTQSALRYDEGTLLGSLMKGANNTADPQKATEIFNTVRNNGSNLHHG